mmetsp:Transcript_25455/g.64496  ORF Transcript_25455/g.64496 Transcript_25455/m.64496 type:complete len:212 (+) Transcript_25455:2790-3425(+)
MQHRGWIEHADRRLRCSLVRLRLLLQHLIERGVQVAPEYRTAGVWALVAHGIGISVAPRDKMLSRGALGLLAAARVEQTLTTAALPEGAFAGDVATRATLGGELLRDRPARARFVHFCPVLHRPLDARVTRPYAACRLRQHSRGARRPTVWPANRVRHARTTCRRVLHGHSRARARFVRAEMRNEPTNVVPTGSLPSPVVQGRRTCFRTAV